MDTIEKKQNVEEFLRTVKSLSSKDKKFSFPTICTMYGITTNAAWILTKINTLASNGRGVYKWIANGKPISEIADEFIKFRTELFKKPEVKKPEIVKPEPTPLAEILMDIQAKIDFIYNELKK